MNERLERSAVVLADNDTWRQQCAEWATRAFGDDGLFQLNTIAPGDCEDGYWTEWRRRYGTVGEI